MGTAAGQPAPAPESERRSEGGFDINRVVASMIGREKGNAKAVIRHLVKEGRRYRLRLKQVEDELKTRPETLAKGSVVLNPEESKKWEALKDIALTPDQVKESIKRRDELEKAERDRTQATLVESASESLGIKRPKLLAEQVQSKGMLAEQRDVEVVQDGKRVKEKQVQVRLASDDKAPWRSMKEFVDADLKDMHPALFADPEPEEGNETSGQPPQGETVVYPAQRGARGRAPVTKDPVVKVIGHRYQSPTEFRNKSK